MGYGLWMKRIILCALREALRVLCGEKKIFDGDRRFKKLLIYRPMAR
jgi:hypothetical protein